MFFGDMHPTCGGQAFPNPLASSNPFENPYAFQYNRFIGARGHAAAMLYTRQLPRVASKVHEMVAAMCNDRRGIAVTATLFSTVNTGAFVRLGDPRVSLSDTFFATQARSPLAKLWGAFWDTVPEGHEFILRGAGTGGNLMALPPSSNSSPPAMHPATAEGERERKRQKQDGWLTFVDRAPCMEVSPLRFFGVAMRMKAPEVPKGKALFVRFCRTLSENAGCDVVMLPEDGDEEVIPLSRVITVFLENADDPDDPNDSRHWDDENSGDGDVVEDEDGWDVSRLENSGRVDAVAAAAAAADANARTLVGCSEAAEDIVLRVKKTEQMPMLPGGPTAGDFRKQQGEMSARQTEEQRRQIDQMTRTNRRQQRQDWKKQNARAGFRSAG